VGLLGQNCLSYIAINPCKLSRGNSFIYGIPVWSKMKHLKKGKKNNVIVTAAKVLSLATIILITGTVVIAPLSLQLAEAFSSNATGIGRSSQAPTVVFGDNIYIAWWTNNTENANQEVMFRASNDGGATFGDKMNLSNTPDADSGRVEIAAEGANVIVTWWETNQTSDTPVARISIDGGETFGAMLRLGANGTLTSTEEGGGAEVAE
jgi:hypothetical protein